MVGRGRSHCRWAQRLPLNLRLGAGVSRCASAVSLRRWVRSVPRLSGRLPFISSQNVGQSAEFAAALGRHVHPVGAGAQLRVGVLDPVE